MKSHHPICEHPNCRRETLTAEVHHALPLALYREFAYDIRWLVCLCRRCHGIEEARFRKYGNIGPLALILPRKPLDLAI